MVSAYTTSAETELFLSRVRYQTSKLRFVRYPCRNRREGRYRSGVGQDTTQRSPAAVHDVSAAVRDTQARSHVRRRRLFRRNLQVPKGRSQAHTRGGLYLLRNKIL